MRVLLTGATGFIGQHCIASLTAQGFEVHAVSSRPLAGVPAGAEWHRVDLLDRSQVGELVSRVRPTHLLHFAWHVVPGAWATSGASENLSWVQASLELLRNFHEYGGCRAVMAGTCAEYDWQYGFCSEFRTPRKPGTVYGTCKNALQTMLDSYAREVGLSHAWGRIFFVYGPYEPPPRLVPSVINSLLRGEPARCSHGDQMRDYLYAKDVADAFVTLMASDVQGPINIASGRAVALKDIICMIAAQLDGEDLIQLGAVPAASDEPPLLVADITRLSSEVGWRPQYDLGRGLSESIRWWKTRRAQCR